MGLKALQLAGLVVLALLRAETTTADGFNPTMGFLVYGPAFCDCDLQANACDANCCCDPLCTTFERDAFVPTCAAQTQAQSVRAFDFSCDWDNPAHTQPGTNGPLYDLLPLLCVHNDNNPLIGLYTPIPGDARSDAAFDAALVKANNNATSFSVLTESLQAPISYLVGTPLETVNADGVFGLLSLPTSSGVGGCTRLSAARFLESKTTQCSLAAEEVQVQCNGNGALNIDSVINGFSIRNVGTGGVTSRVPTTVTVVNTTCIQTKTTAQCAVGNVTTSFDAASNTCLSAVVSVQYTVRWSGQDILSATVNVQTNDVSATSDVLQSFSVEFVTSTSPGVAYSGSPGYLTGLPVRAAAFDSANDLLVSSPLRALSSGPDGSCGSASTSAIPFGSDSVSGCTLSLSLEDFEDCGALAARVQQVQDAGLVRSGPTHVASFGNSPIGNLDEWVDILDTTTAANLAEAPDMPHCKNIPAAVSITFLVALQGSKSNPQSRIVGVLRERVLSTWQLLCTADSDCKASLAFPVSNVVRFETVTSRALLGLTTPRRRAQCPRRRCYERAFHPLKHTYTDTSSSHPEELNQLAILSAAGLCGFAVAMMAALFWPFRLA